VDTGWCRRWEEMPLRAKRIHAVAKYIQHMSECVSWEVVVMMGEVGNVNKF
jgi:hypothetical protein